MAKDEETMEVWMLARVRGEDGEALPTRSKQTVGAVFGRSLLFSNRAQVYDGQGATAPAKTKGTKKAAPKVRTWRRTT